MSKALSITIIYYVFNFKRHLETGFSIIKIVLFIIHPYILRERLDGGDDEARRFSRPPPRSVQLRSFEANLSSHQHKSCLLPNIMSGAREHWKNQ